MTDTAKKHPVDQDETPAAPAEGTHEKKESEAKGAAPRSNAIWMGTAVGIGSAALVAALMYARRRK